MPNQIPSLAAMAGEKTKQSSWGRELARAKAIVRRHETDRYRFMMREWSLQQNPRFLEEKNKLKQAKRTLDRISRQKLGVSSYANLRHEMALPSELSWV